MRQLAWMTGCVCVLGLAGCPQTTSPDGGTDVPVVGAENAADAASDAAIGDAAADATTAMDVQLVDVQAQPDASDSGPPPMDVPGDTGPASLEGRWRLVRYDVPGDAGLTMLTDMNQAFPTAGGSVQARVNGVLTLAPNRLSLSFGFLINDHFVTDQTMAAPANAFGAYGIGAPGTLTASSFSIPLQPPINFVLNADGTISQLNSDGNTFRWMRAPTVPDVATVMRQGVLFRLAPTMSAALASPRAALAWDRPGSGAGYVFTDDAAIAFLPGGVAAFNINVTAAPASAVVTTDGTQHAIAYVVVYDDRDGNNAYTPSTGSDSGSGDVVRGFSPVAVAWRSATAPSTTFSTGAFRDLGPGFQFAHIHPDYTVGAGVGVTPFDNTHLVNPDGMITIGAAPVSAAAPMGIPNLVL